MVGERTPLVPRVRLINTDQIKNVAFIFEINRIFSLCHSCSLLFNVLNPFSDLLGRSCNTLIYEFSALLIDINCLKAEFYNNPDQGIIDGQVMILVQMQIGTLQVAFPCIFSFVVIYLFSMF